MNLRFRFIGWVMALLFAALLATRCAMPPVAPLPPQATSPAPNTTPNIPTIFLSDDIILSGDNRLFVHFLDVGQGDATLFQSDTPGDDVTILIDAGRHNNDNVVPHLERLGITELDLLIGTHPHADHIGQFPQVLARFPVGEIWLPGSETTTATYERVLDAIAASDAGYHEPRAGEVYDIGPLVVQVVSPAQLFGDLDDDSIAVRVLFGEVAFLLTGDAGTRAEDAMIARAALLASQVLQLGHHGSRTSSGEPFLRAVAPRLAIWSAGVDNPFGHPHPDVVERLACLGIPTYGTAEHGSITAQTDGAEIVLEVELPNGTRGPPTPTPWVCEDDGATTTQCRADQVNVNRADLDALQSIVHIGPERAQMLMGLRPYTSLDDLTRIPGIGPALVDAIREQGVACVEP